MIDEALGVAPEKIWPSRYSWSGQRWGLRISIPRKAKTQP
ncbi:helix-turn-helix domain-containing protein [Salmonella enterica]|nr:transcriptional regulator [Salmonella enterica]EHB9597129.1 transcriptional regulator [Salmonella enterica]EHY6132660.1 helix-turn-helix domain-containing protein [Salmonella enterica]EJV7700373.1 helix-turn-helix domain-containing protein [Salmonella enterica]ELB6640782.1 helix-turn-helix domain-containing protein [Salmonella enterica]